MNAHALDLDFDLTRRRPTPPASLASSALASPAAPALCDAARDAAGDTAGELLDEDLEHVVGGLARVWVDAGLAARAPFAPPTA